MLLLFFITALCSPVRSYILYDEPRTWFEAQSFCREHHLDLATITNSADATLLSTDVTGTDFAWIGLFDDMTEWRWSDGNVDLSSTNFTNWEPSSPDFHTTYKSDTKVCVGMLTNGLWDDTDCYYANSKVCSADVLGLVYSTSPGTWLYSQDYCRVNFRDLATVTNLNENTAVNNEISKTSWIGLYRHTWTNWSDSTFSSFSIWDDNMNIYLNTSASFHCAMVYLPTGTWFRGSCDSKIPFVCNGPGSSSGTSGTFKPGYSSQVKLRLKSEADLNNADVQSQILRQIEAKMLDQGLSEFKLRWTEVERESLSEEEEREPCTNI